MQVHPNDTQAARLQPPDLGKTEAWIVVHADPGSGIFAGLKEGVDRHQFELALRAEKAEECLHRFEPRSRGLYFHSGGNGSCVGRGTRRGGNPAGQRHHVSLVRLEPSLESDGRPRQLHIEEGLAVTDFATGPVQPQVPVTTDQRGKMRLVACEQFVVDRWELHEAAALGGDQRFHLLAVLEGSLRLDGDPAGQPLRKGQTTLLPAALGVVAIESIPTATVLDMYLP